LVKALEIGGNLSYLQKTNISHPEIQFTDIPWGKVIGYVKYTPISGCYALANAEFDTWRYTTSQGSRVPGYTLWNASLGVPLGANVLLEGGVKNAFDANYSLEEGYPEEGRTFFVTLHTNFNID
jgi:iron complex outermembrane receptor protein